MSQQRLHERDVASQHGRVQRRVAGADGIGIRALLEEQCRNVSVPAVGGEHQRAGAVGQ
jgi:hypothetical protein